MEVRVEEGGETRWWRWRTGVGNGWTLFIFQPCMYPREVFLCFVLLYRWGIIRIIFVMISFCLVKCVVALLWRLVGSGF